MKALCFDRFGGPDVLEYRDVPDPDLVPGQALVRMEAIGLNFCDIGRRQGVYPMVGVPPYIGGFEGAGEVVAFDGEGPFRLGDRVAFADSGCANAQHVAVGYDKLVPVPEDISCEMAAAVLLQGLMAHFLVRESHTIRAGEKVLIHAAAGGTGLLLVQMVKAAGARVLALTSSSEKMEAALNAGADAVALYEEDWVSVASEFDGAGIDVGYDSVGSTLLATLDAAHVGGHVVLYGMAGGPPPTVDARALMSSSKTVTGGDLRNVLTTAEQRRARADELFNMIRTAKLRVHIGARFALDEGARAHAFLESRKSTGKVLLIP